MISVWLKDPLAFVEQAFTWGEGSLANHDGPESWQRDLLTEIRDGMSTAEALRIARAAGHNVGKSACVSWLILWAMLRPDTRGVVTANTATQLETKTWAELAKWYQLCRVKELWRLTATMISAADPQRARTWRVDAIPWSENRTEAFAGLHNQGKRTLILFDEASAIADVIWEVTEGATYDADTEIIWACFGNPTRNSGRFRECFGRQRNRWRTGYIDSREVRFSNREEIEAMIKDYGEDSDFVRVRVKGQFPRASSMQFIPTDVAEEAATRENWHSPAYEPLVIGVDVARFGDDSTCIAFRKGRDGRSVPTIRLRGCDTVHVALRAAEEFDRYRAHTIFVDGTGVGGGVVDYLRHLNYPVVDVQFGAAASRSDAIGEAGVGYANRRAELWGKMRAWLKSGGTIENDPDLISDLTGVEYGYTLKEGRDAIILEKKEAMKKRGLASPDAAEALAVTFALPIAEIPAHHLLNQKTRHVADYDPFASSYNLER